MRQPIVMVSTCGTSLLTNGATDSLRQGINRYANEKDLRKIPDDIRNSLEEWLGRKNELLAATTSLNEVQKLSAELNSLIRFYEGRLEGERDQNFLLCTDTWLGSATVEIIRHWLSGYFASAQANRVSDLQTAEISGFRLAMSELVRWSEETLPGYRDNGYRVIFNLTGVFKSIQGFM